MSSLPTAPSAPGAVGPMQPSPPASSPDADDKLTWESGDFRPHPRTSAPYNGVRMHFDPQYDEKGDLYSLRLDVTDFASTPHGAKHTYTFQPIESGQELKLQRNDRGHFTVAGSLEIERSPVKPDELVVMFRDGSYGPKTHIRQVIGGLIGIPLKGQPTQKNGSSGHHPGSTHPGSTHPGSTHPGSNPSTGHGMAAHGTGSTSGDSAQSGPQDTSPGSPQTGAPPDETQSASMAPSVPPLKTTRDASGLHITGHVALVLDGTRQIASVSAVVPPTKGDSGTSPAGPDSEPNGPGTGSADAPNSETSRTSDGSSGSGGDSSSHGDTLGDEGSTSVDDGSTSETDDEGSGAEPAASSQSSRPASPEPTSSTDSSGTASSGTASSGTASSGTSPEAPSSGLAAMRDPEGNVHVHGNVDLTLGGRRLRAHVSAFLPHASGPSGS